MHELRAVTPSLSLDEKEPEPKDLSVRIDEYGVGKAGQRERAVGSGNEPQAGARETAEKVDQSGGREAQSMLAPESAIAKRRFMGGDYHRRGVAIENPLASVMGDLDSVGRSAGGAAQKGREKSQSKR